MGNSYLGVLYNPVDFWESAQAYIDRFFDLYLAMVARIGSLVQEVEGYLDGDQAASRALD